MDDAANADDGVALRRTIRRCTALLVGAIGIHLETLTAGEAGWGLLMATVAGLYLFASVTDLEGDASAADGDGPDDAGDGERAAARSDAGD
jgi:hypothetical protein